MNEIIASGLISSIFEYLNLGIGDGRRKKLKAESSKEECLKLGRELIGRDRFSVRPPLPRDCIAWSKRITRYVEPDNNDNEKDRSPKIKEID